MEYCLDEGISLSTISQRRMSASFDRRLPSSLERRLSGQGKQHLGHRERAVDRVSLALVRRVDPGTRGRAERRGRG